MVVWNGAESEEFGELYAFCKKRGSPDFNSPYEMAEWIRSHFKGKKFAWLIRSITPLLNLVLTVESDILQSLRRFLLSVRRAICLKLQRKSGQDEYTLTPLMLNRRSLHPIEFDTLVWGV
jgi:hypothetical protein